MIIIGSPQWLFIAEAMGCDQVVKTREARINAVIEDIRNYEGNTYEGDTMDESVFLSILDRHELTDLSDREYQRILDSMGK